MNEKFFRALLPFFGLAVFLGIVLLAMKVLFARERVKADLQKRQLNPVRVRWRPFATLIFWQRSSLGANFEATYSDASGQHHKALCVVLGGTSKVEWQPAEPISTKPRA